LLLLYFLQFQVFQTIIIIQVFAQTNQASDQSTTSNATDQSEITTVNKTIIPAQQTTVKANQTVIMTYNNQTQ